MQSRSLLILAAAAVLLGGCATKEYVNEQIAGLGQRLDGQQAETSGKLSQTSAQVQGLENRLGVQQTELEKVSGTAQEALQRAEAAGKLAEGQLLYETTISSQVANFSFNGSQLSAEMKQALDDFAAKLKTENRNVYIEIQGHTDSIGTPEYNLALGQARAEAVRRYLAMQHGIPLHRMNVISYGESAPVADNMYRPGRAENRRVTLVVLQ
jgi:outer membrane protein OmpA-like peptidoglycan-associated protein